jgi:hypothetical protein
MLISKQIEIVRRSVYPSWDKTETFWFIVRVRTRVLGLTIHRKTIRTWTPEGPETMRFGSVIEAREWVEQILMENRKPGRIWDSVMWKIEK